MKKKGSLRQGRYRLSLFGAIECRSTCWSTDGAALRSRSDAVRLLLGAADLPAFPRRNSPKLLCWPLCLPSPPFRVTAPPPLPAPPSAPTAKQKTFECDIDSVQKLGKDTDRLTRSVGRPRFLRSGNSFDLCPQQLGNSRSNLAAEDTLVKSSDQQCESRQGS